MERGPNGSSDCDVSLLYFGVSFTLSIILQTTDDFVYTTALVISGIVFVIMLIKAIFEYKEDQERWGKMNVHLHTTFDEGDPINNAINVYETGIKAGDQFIPFQSIADIEVSEVIEKSRYDVFGDRVATLHINIRNGNTLTFRGNGKTSNYCKIRDYYYDIKNEEVNG